jgi:hypothetical protein
MNIPIMRLIVKILQVVRGVPWIASTPEDAPEFGEGAMAGSRQLRRGNLSEP